MQRIIYPQDNGIVAVVIPSPEWQGTMEELATRVVPLGTPYRVVATADIPTDRSQRNLWEGDFAAPDGYGGRA